MLLSSSHVVTFSCPPLPTPPPLPTTDGDETAPPPTIQGPQQETPNTPQLPFTTQETWQEKLNTPPLPSITQETRQKTPKTPLTNHPTAQRSQQPDTAEPPTTTNLPISSNDDTKPNTTTSTIFGTSEKPDVPVQNSVGNATTLLVALTAGSISMIIFVVVVALIIVCLKRRKYSRYIRVATNAACGVAFHEDEHSERNKFMNDCVSLQDVEIKHNDATDTIDSEVNHSDVNPQTDTNEVTYDAYASNPIKANIAELT